MPSPVENLPNDIDELKKLIVSLSVSNESLHAENKLLHEKVHVLNSRLFGLKSERLSPQELLQSRLFDEIEDVESHGPELDFDREDDETEVRTHKRKKKGRKTIPEHLPREEVIVDMPESEKICGCGAEKVRIGEEISEKLDIIPQKIIVQKTVRPKYACRNCRGEDDNGPAVAIAPVPPCITGKSILSAVLFARMIVSKFCDALPFYRQEKMFNRSGIEISRTTMSSLAMDIHERLSPLQSLMEKNVRKSSFLGIDETTVQVMKEKGRKDTTKSFMWVFRAATREGPLIYFRYEPTRSPGFLSEFLNGFRGTTQTDGYNGYDVLDRMPGVIHIGCMAHARRKFVEAEKAAPGDERAKEILLLFGKLYRIEESLRSENAFSDRVLQTRREKSLPLFRELQEKIDRVKSSTAPKSLFGKAANYFMNERKKLEACFSNGELPIDNNLVENAIRPFVVGRKNWLFAGRPEGAAASAFFYSLIETAKANDLNPEEYMIRLFEKAPLSVSAADWEALLPLKQNWPEASSGG